MPKKEPNSTIQANVGFAAGFATARATLLIHGPLPTEQPFYAHVGRVASEWAHLEHILDLIIWELTGLNPKLAACLTSQIMGVGPRCKTIMTLGVAQGIDHQTVLKPFKSLMSDSYPIADLRARIVHDAWYAEYTSGSPYQFRAMPYGDQRYGLQDVTTAEIDNVINKIKPLQERANLLRASVSTAFATLRGMPG